MSDAVSKFITTLIVHFPVKHESPDREAEWLRSMVRNMKGFPAEVLRRAAESLVNTRKDRRFPLPSECKQACFEASKAVTAERPTLDILPSLSAYSDDREKLAYELLLGPLGRQAAREGWIHSLFTYTRDHMRLPQTDGEIGFCRKAAREFDRALENCRAAPYGSPQGNLVKLGISMLEKRNALTTYVETGLLP